MSEPTPEDYGVNYDIITINLNTKRIVRDAALIVATAVLTKSAMDVAGYLVKKPLVKFVKKLKTRAIDEAHKKAEAKVREEESQ